MERDRTTTLSLCPAHERDTHTHTQIFPHFSLEELRGIEGTKWTQDRQRGLWEPEVTRWEGGDWLVGSVEEMVLNGSSCTHILLLK